MRVPAFLICLALGLAGCGTAIQPVAQVRVPDGAAVVGRTQVAPNIVDLTVRSPALGRTVKVRLLTPNGWGKRAAGQRWPVLYLLHGCCGSYKAWTQHTDVAKLKALRNVLVVMPEGADGWYSDWRHGPQWETFDLVELRGLLEKAYGAGTQRAVAGNSMGGLGALDYAAMHPTMFKAAASFSGVTDPLRDASTWYALMGRHTADPADIWGNPRRQPDVWLAHDPTALAHRLRHTRLFLSVGDGRSGPFDKPGVHDHVEAELHAENEALAARLRHFRIPVTLDFYGPGTHTWPYFQRELHRALPLLLRAIGPVKRGGTIEPTLGT